MRPNIRGIPRVCVCARVLSKQTIALDLCFSSRLYLEECKILVVLNKFRKIACLIDKSS
jgi:hypothetical protein